MVRILIKNLARLLVARLRRAATADLTMEQRSRETLAVACGDQSEMVTRLRQRHASYGKHIFSDGAAIVREMRDQRVL